MSQSTELSPHVATAVIAALGGVADGCGTICALAEQTGEGRQIVIQLRRTAECAIGSRINDVVIREVLNGIATAVETGISQRGANSE